MTRKQINFTPKKIGRFLGHGKISNSESEEQQTYTQNGETNRKNSNSFHDKLQSPAKSNCAIEARKVQINYFQLFRYSTVSERTLLFFGLFCSAISAMGLPLSIVLYGEFTTLLVDRAVRVGSSTETLLLSKFGGGRILKNASLEENRKALIEDSEAFGIGSAIVSTVLLIIAAIGVDLMNYTALKQIARIRTLFLRAVLRQDMAWFDTNKDNNFASRITDDLEKLKEGIGDKLAMFIYLVMSFIISIIFSFAYGWKLTLVIISCSPLIIITQAVVAKIQSSLTEKELKSYSSAGSVAEEVLSGIRTVIAFGGEKKELQRYKERLRPAEENGERKGLFTGLGGGLMWLIIYCCYALAFWYGVELILESRASESKEYTPAVLVIVLVGVLFGAQNLGLTSPHLEAFAVARGAAWTVFSVIDRKPIIDSLAEDGVKAETVKGDIEFKSIIFRYPARPDVEVLKGLDLSIKAGQSVALVGPSGCGKSTLLQLLQRLYDPLDGTVSIDGMNLKNVNVAWLRSMIGVVGQEPVLFATTITENIRYGNPSATQKEIEKAAKIANCHDFILKLPEGYETLIGERGAQLSGGQKQRIAIARAIVRNPNILLLDEATSALDPTSEKQVQIALEKASKGRTTLVVSHRLSTITNSDKIAYVQSGVVKEQGNHEELMASKGLYYNLVITTNTNLLDPQDPKRTAAHHHHSQHTRKTSISLHDSTEYSGTDDEAQEAVEKDEEEEKYSIPLGKLMKLNAPEWKLNLIGSFAALLQGSSLPIFAILFGEFYGILSIPDAADVRRQSNLFSIFFVLLGIVAGCGTFFQTFMFNKAGVRMTSRLRQNTFQAVMSQEIAWFDETKNSVGGLCARLAGDCASVQGATGSRIGAIIQSVCTLLVGVVISFFFSWNLTLVSILTVPIVLGSVYCESRYMASSSMDEKYAIERASKMAVQAIANIRTVASLGQEPYILERYCREIDSVVVACRKKGRLRGIVFALGQSSPFFAYGLALYYGGCLVANDGLEYKNVIKVSEALIFGAWMLGQAFSYAPNVNAALLSAGRLVKILERQPKVKNPPVLLCDDYNIEGNISYQGVEFRYPTRPETLVLQGLNLEISKGMTVALVGPSGSGKSTCIQLLLRYYDPESGKTNLDATPTVDFSLEKLRSHIGLVSQEPVLFDRTIADNIAYGENSREIPISEIIEAAKKANIHEFIINLPLGYETGLGSKGTQLSGGQKQRIAIARALVRNPQILLLDEATSALDNQSEKVVQAALDSAREGRTCITIAHRLTTIQNADLICVIQNGVVIENGTHDELIARDGMYAKLYKMQQIS